MRLGTGGVKMRIKSYWSWWSHYIVQWVYCYLLLYDFFIPFSHTTIKRSLPFLNQKLLFVWASLLPPTLPSLEYSYALSSSPFKWCSSLLLRPKLSLIVTFDSFLYKMVSSRVLSTCSQCFNTLHLYSSQCSLHLQPVFVLYNSPLQYWGVLLSIVLCD